MIVVSGRRVANISIARKSFSNGTVDVVADWGISHVSKNDDYHAISLLPFQNDNLEGFLHTYQGSSRTMTNKVLSQILYKYDCLPVSSTKDVLHTISHAAHYKC